MKTAEYVKTALEQHGKPVDVEAFRKGMDRFKRHVRNKYGSLNWESEVGECGHDGWHYFYEEVLDHNGRTFNEHSYDNRR